MQQQVRKGQGRWLWLPCLSGIIGVLWLSGSPASPVSAPSSHFPLPKNLEPNVAFWIHVFTAVDTRGGVLHDPDDLRIIYQTLTNLPTDRQERQDLLDSYRQYYEAVLYTLASGRRTHLTKDQQRVLKLFEGKQTSGAFRQAASQIRFQGGIRDRFMAGMVRSGAYMPTIEHIFRTAGLPKELTLLPHIESSFVNAAYSKYGAAGIWQFMPATGRRFLTINRYVDERLDINIATFAAAKLLQENYDRLGTWPLAITAYNHGTNGMERAVAEVGTNDIGVIVERYRGPYFGFASRNFYAEFLAAVEVATHYKRYFGPLNFEQPGSPQTLVALSPSQPSPPQISRPKRYRVQRGDTLSGIAERFGTTTRALMSINRIRRSDHVRVGQVLTLPAASYQPPPPAVAQSTTRAVQSTTHYRVKRGDTLSAIAARFNTSVTALALRNNIKRPYRVTVGQMLAVKEPAAPRRYRVRPGDTLTAIAERFDLTVEELATHNNIRRPYRILPGQLLKLPDASPQAGLLPDGIERGQYLAPMGLRRHLV